MRCARLPLKARRCRTQERHAAAMAKVFCRSASKRFCLRDDQDMPVTPAAEAEHVLEADALVYS